MSATVARRPLVEALNIAHQILERHHQASAREIAYLLLDAAGVEVGP